MHRQRPGKTDLTAWLAAAAFAAWAGLVAWFYFAQFAPAAAALWRRLPW